MELNVSSTPLSRLNQADLFIAMETEEFMSTLFYYLFGTSDYADHVAFEATSSEVICGTTWGKGGIAFRCMDCEKDHNCVVCAACFFDSEEKHASHRVKLIRTTGGCCEMLKSS